MKKSYQTLLLLQQQFPNDVMLYSPANELQVSVDERMLGLELPSELKELWSLTNGFSIIDYCFLGSGNKVIVNLLGLNFPLEIREYGYSLGFLSTSGSDNFYLVYNCQKEFSGVFYSSDYGETLGTRFDSLGHFLTDFLERIAIVLGKYGDEALSQPLQYE